ncbi:MAG: D-alanyl-D-alanine carboxypeptidase [Oscillospiraceae bacterium]|nr:D-alanyl-D-alanine carboxypeptidase [Oscillospiraceae bacterium]
MSKKQNKFKKTVCVFVAASIALLSSISALGDTADFPKSVEAKAALVMESESGRILFAQNERERLPMASTTKMMTALITLEQPQLDAQFKAEDSALRVEGSSMGLCFGDTVTLRALAAGMLLASGNDAANAAAMRIAGGIPQFAALMNERAEQLELTDTHFVNPSGLDDEEHYSTAYDLAVIAREALKNPNFRELCSSVTAKAEFGSPPTGRTLKNHNKLLKLYPGAIGVKTGFTKKAGRCLVSAAEKNGVTLICVTLGCPDDWNVHTSLLESCFDGRERRDLTKLLPQTEVTVTGGTVDRAKLGAKRHFAALTQAEFEAVTWKIYKEPFVFAPVEKGAVCGWAEFMLNGEIIGRAELTAAETAAAAKTQRGFGWFISRLFRQRVSQ